MQIWPHMLSTIAQQLLYTWASTPAPHRHLPRPPRGARCVAVCFGDWRVFSFSPRRRVARAAAMGVLLGTLIHHPDELPPLVLLQIAALQSQRAIPPDPNLGFCYRMLARVSRSFSIVIQQLSPELRDAVSLSASPRLSPSVIFCLGIFYILMKGVASGPTFVSVPFLCARGFLSALR